MRTGVRMGRRKAMGWRKAGLKRRTGQRIKDEAVCGERSKWAVVCGGREFF